MVSPMANPWCAHGEHGPAPRAQHGMSLLELLVAMAIAAVIMVPLAAMVRNALDAQTLTRERNDLAQQARFALRRMAAAVQATPSSRTLAAKAANTTGDWLSPLAYCLNASARLIETTPADAACSGTTVIADHVGAFSVQTYAAGPNAAPVIEIQLTLSATAAGSIALTAHTRLGGGTL